MRRNYRFQIIIYQFIAMIFCLSFLVSVVYADTSKLTILYTGETHSMLYPCDDCSLGLDGGLAERATKINEVRKSNPNVLLLDSGGVFAGGLLDEYTQNVELDRQRTLLNLEAMRIMGYDAVAIGDEEFNFGEDFLKNSIEEKSIPFVSSNIENDYVLSSIIKTVGHLKIGILALSPNEIKNKIDNIKYIEPQETFKKNIRALRKQGVDIIIVLSHLGEEEDLVLINEMEEIDILVAGHRLSNKPDSDTKIGQTIILRPTWQGRKLGKVELDIEDGKITNYDIDDIMIDKKIKGDRRILAILPECFSDKDCRKKGFWGTCKDSATVFSKCAFKKIEPVSVLIIKPKICRTCDIERAVGELRDAFGNIKVSYLNYETRKGKKLVKSLGIDMLPAYLLGGEVRRNESFSNFSKFLIPKKDKYLVDPSRLGVSFFLDREIKKGHLDLFISLFDKNSNAFLRLMKDFTKDRRRPKFNLHFLGIIEDEVIITPYGLVELEEDLRASCVMNKYPNKWWDYLFCRTENIQSSWWDDCLESCGMNMNLIKQCSKSKEGKKLLLENVGLSSELKIRSSGTFLLNNQEVFSTVDILKEDELERIIR